MLQGVSGKDLKLPEITPPIPLKVYKGSQAALMEAPKMRDCTKFGDLLDAAGISITASNFGQNKVAYSHRLLAAGSVLQAVANNFSRRAQLFPEGKARETEVM